MASTGGGGLIASSAEGFWVLRLLERGGGYSSECSESVYGIQCQRMLFTTLFVSLDENVGIQRK